MDLEPLILLGEEGKLTFALGPHTTVPPPIHPPETAGVAESFQPAPPQYLWSIPQEVKVQAA